MCAFQSDPKFKRFQCVMEYANKEKTMEVVEEDDQQVLVLLLMKVSKHLDLGLIENPLLLTSNFGDSYGNCNMY